MWDLIVSVPDHCLSFYFRLAPVLKTVFFLILCLGASLIYIFIASLILMALF